MTIGIYKLVFEGTDKVYIGQSINIEKRFLEHLRNLKNNKASRKLQLAYNSFGNPKSECVIDCNIEELDELETLAIKLHDSFNNGFNSLESACEIPKTDNTGDKHGRSKYTNTKIIEVFNLLVEFPRYTQKQISDITGVTTNTVSHISQGTRHTWLKEAYPDKYTILMSLKGTRNSAKHLGIVYPPIISPEGIKYIVDSPAAFARLHNISNAALVQVLNKRTKHTMGWTLCQEDNQ